MAGQGQRGGPLGQEVDPNYVDDGTSCRQRMLPPVPIGIPGIPGIPDYYCGRAGPDPITVLGKDPRIHAVEIALERSRPIFETQLKAIFSGLDITPILQSLWDTVRKAASILGGSALLGSAIGLIAGGGVGALPGAAAGLSVGIVIMNLLGLGELIAEIPERVEAITGPYRKGFVLAWNAPEDPQHEEENINEAAMHFGAGHVVVALAVLAAIIAYATRGKGKKIKEILERSRLKGPRSGSRSTRLS